MSLRLILESVETREELGGTCRQMFTMDVDLPAVEAELRRGGRGEMGSHYVRFIGIEVLPVETKP